MDLCLSEEDEECLCSDDDLEWLLLLSLGLEKEELSFSLELMEDEDPPSLYLLELEDPLPSLCFELELSR